jgi:hypothetical protein
MDWPELTRRAMQEDLERIQGENYLECLDELLGESYADLIRSIFNAADQLFSENFEKKLSRQEELIRKTLETMKKS